jgi:anti-sigma factor RsiW
MSKRKNTHPTLRTLLLRYLRGELPDEDRQAFEHQLLLTQAARTALDNLEESDLTPDELAADLQDMEQRWHQRHSPAATQRPWLGRVAVVALVLITCWAVYGYYQDQRSNRLFAEYFSGGQSREYLSVRGTADPDPAFAAAFRAYQEQDFSNSLLLFQEVRFRDATNTQALLYTALSAIQVGQSFTARQALEQLLNQELQPAERSEGYWFLALVHLQEHHLAEARAALQWLVTHDTGERGEQARKLLAEIGQQ